MANHQPIARKIGRSLAYTNFKRAANVGKIYLLMSIAVSIFISLEFLAVSRLGSASSGAVPSSISALPALILPAFTVIGSFGSLMIFVSDKDKGVYEYLIAYGINTSKIFWSIVLATIGLVSIVLCIDIVLNLAISLYAGSVTLQYVELLIFYVVPISYAVSIFMSVVGMIWSFLARRRTGINSPVGVVSIIGIVPVFAVLLVSFIIPSRYTILFAGLVSVALFVAVGLVLRVSSTKMVRERFLSNA